MKGRRTARKAADRVIGGGNDPVGGVTTVTAEPPVVARIEMWSIDRLRPLARNPREHSPAQIDEIVESIRRFGFLAALVVDEARGVVLAGNGRLAAAAKLGMREVPVIPVGHLSAGEQKQYIIADNRIALNATWSEEILAQYFEQIEQLGLDPTATFFSQAEIDEILDGFADAHATVIEDEVPELPKDPVSRTGDVWRMGDHIVVCGDATDIDVVRCVLPDTAAMCFTDPPYDIAYRGSGRQVAEGNARAPIANDDLGADWEPFIAKLVANILACTNGGVYVAIGWQRVGTLIDTLMAAGAHVSTTICWGKNHFVLGGGDYNPQFELIVYCWREGSDRMFNGGDGESNLWLIDRPSSSPLHPTMKPAELVARAVRNSSRPDDTILDVCAGSGTTIIAAEQLNRRCASVELDPGYVDVIVQRWEALTGRSAILNITGQTFNEAAAERRGVSCP